MLDAPERPRPVLAEVPPRSNGFLSRAVGLVRPRFGGKLGYASPPFEGVDWSPFDVLSTDAGDRFVDDIRAFVAQGHRSGKPVAMIEFGCCLYRGAADRGGRGDRIVQWDGGRPVRLDGDSTRDEDEQATYLAESAESTAVASVWRARVGDVGQAPVAQGAHGRRERSAGLGEVVVPAAGVVPVRGAGDQAGLLEALETVGQDVGGNALDGSEELAVARLAAQQVADDQQRPAVAEQVEGTGDGTGGASLLAWAGLGRRAWLGGLHIASIRATLSGMVTCKSKAKALGPACA